MNGINQMQRGNRRGPTIIQVNSTRGLIDLIHLLAGRMNPEMQRGMTKEQIGAFPVHKFKAKPKKEGEDDDMCIICYCAFEEGEDCMTLPCTHVFHPECVGTWLEKSSTCPVCKHNYGENESGEEPNMQRRQPQRQP